MPGFFIEIGKSSKSKNFEQDKKLINAVIDNGDFYAERRTINKFLDDKLFIDNELYFYVLDGVVLNKNEMLKKYSSNWEETFIKLYEKNGDDFYKEFRGSFCGAIFDKKNNKWTIFADHIASRHIYFSNNGSNLVLSTDIKLVYDYFKINEMKYKLDKDAAYLLLSYGFMLEDYTLCSDIKKLLPGHNLLYINNELVLNQYYKLSNVQDNTKTEDELIELMDHYFRQAIKRQFEKDKEYGYKHLVALSGGLDSRMTCWVAHDMGYEKQVNFTFSQSDYLDETIAKEIARDLNHEWIFKALDGGNFLLDFDEITDITGGNVLYYGLAHGNSLMKLLNFDTLGLNHSGQLGDVVFGTFFKSQNRDAQWKVGDGAYSTTFIDKTKKIKLNMQYENQELFNFYNRGFAGANNGLLATQQYTETMSPFYDIDLLDFALSIPLEYRYDHQIYKKWIIKKYPKAADYVWEKTKSKITEPTIKYKGKKYYIKQFFFLIANKLSGNRLAGHDSKKNMNPLGYWYDTNLQLKNVLDEYFKKHIGLVDDKELQKDLKELYLHGKVVEKVQVISLLAAITSFYAITRLHDKY